MAWAPMTSEEGCEIPIRIGSSAAETCWSLEQCPRLGDVPHVGLFPDLFFSQFQFPMEAELGSPSSAFNAAASTNFVGLALGPPRASSAMG